MSVRAVTGIEEFESLRGVWDDLLGRSRDGNIYLTWEWMFTWWRHYGDGRRLSILLVEEEGRVVGILPLMRSRIGLGPIAFDLLEIIGIPDADFGGAILADREEEAVLSLLEYFRGMMPNSGAILLLSQIPEGVHLLGLMRKHHLSFSSSLVMDERILTTCPYIVLPPTWEGYLESLRGKRRHNLRNTLRSLQRTGVVEFRKFDSNRDLTEEMGRIIELHQKRWRQQNLSGVFSDPRASEFYLDVAKAFWQRGWLDLSFIDVGGEAVSAVLGFRYNQRFYYAITAFDPGYGRYSVGNLHIMFLIEDAIKRGDREFDFLIGGETYKLYWTRSARNNIRILLAGRRFAAVWRARILLAIMRLNDIRRRGLLENYRLYREMRREGRRRREMETRNS